ncbi:SCO7613 C-terminal domain-containing membrane protein [Geodermatophilus maliterrae]|uniref:SCO7613 C-terminal domain-containing membrane protein n=1 Tax=Geodermatophilus maliterrae TaxID=3162531 RepID=A0ABV3XC39_9ACTN
MASAPRPPLPYPGSPPRGTAPPRDPVARLRPPQVLLAVGVVLLVAAGVAGPALVGDGAARTGVLVLAALAAAASAWAGRTPLRSTEEACAAAAAALALTGAATGDRPLDGGPVPTLVLAAVLVGLRVLRPRPLTWPLAAWVALQVAVLRSLDLVAGGPRSALLLAVALTGLAVTLAGRPRLARIALLTTAPWWAAGVTGGLVSAATDSGPARWLPAVLTVAVAAALLPVRLDRSVGSLLGPPRAVPVLAGLVAGGAVGAALSTDGPVPLPLAGLLGVYLVAVAAATLEGWRRGLLLPAAEAAGGVLVALSVAQLVAAARWPALVLLLVLTALPAVGVAAVRRDERPTAVPTAVGCLAAAALLAVPAGLLGTAASAAALTALFAATLAARPGMAADVRGPTGAAGAACAATALVVLAVVAAWAQLALHLAVQGALTYAWARLLARQPGTGARDEAGSTRRVGAAQLVAAAWTCAALAGATTVEAWSLPAAAGLLLAAGPELSRGPSWPAWGPGLVVAAAPSTVAAVVQPGALRPVLVLLVAAAVMAPAARAALRAPLVTGAATAVTLALGLVVVALPLPLAGVLVVGTALLVLGARRESHPVAGFGARLSEMR